MPLHPDCLMALACSLSWYVMQVNSVEIACHKVL